MRELKPLFLGHNLLQMHGATRINTVGSHPGQVAHVDLVPFASQVRKIRPTTTGAQFPLNISQTSFMGCSPGPISIRAYSSPHSGLTNSLWPISFPSLVPSHTLCLPSLLKFGIRGFRCHLPWLGLYRSGPSRGLISLPEGFEPERPTWSGLYAAFIGFSCPPIFFRYHRLIEPLFGGFSFEQSGSGDLKKPRQSSSFTISCLSSSYMNIHVPVDEFEWHRPGNQSKLK